MQFLLVFLGGGLGSVLRFSISKWIPFSPNQFPWATLTANILSCFFLGLLFYIFINRTDLSQSQKVFFTAGFCGGFSTFSTFSLENYQFLQNGNWSLGIINILGSICLGLLGLWLGVQVAKMVFA